MTAVALGNILTLSIAVGDVARKPATKTDGRNGAAAKPKIAALDARRIATTRPLTTFRNSPLHGAKFHVDRDQVDPFGMMQRAVIVSASATEWEVSALASHANPEVHR